jgi:hypothetical protein
VFDEEVGNPSKSIWNQQARQNEPWMPENKGREQERPADQSSHRMKHACERLTMR